MKSKFLSKYFQSIGFTFLFVQAAFGAPENPAKRDPADQIFRRAPMAATSRTIAISITTNSHLAFDAQLLRTHTAWAGPSLSLLGPPYSGKKTPFICTFDGATLWTMPPFYPWSVGEMLPQIDSTNSPAKAKFRGISTKSGNATLIYDIAASNGKSVRIHETPIRQETIGTPTIIRRFEIAPCSEALWFLAHAELGKFLPPPNSATVSIQRTNDTLSISANGFFGLKWQPVEKDVNYEVERTTDAGSAKGNPRDKISGNQSRAYLKIPPHRAEIAFEIASTVGDNVFVSSPGKIQPTDMGFVASGKKSPVATSPRISRADPIARRPVGGDEFYRIEHFPLPKEIDLLVSGMDWLPDGNLAVCTWPGEIYIVENAQGPVEAATYRRFARGLNEPMGLKVVDGKIYVAQKAELTCVTDTDGNGEADLYETVNADWGYSGHYDAFAFGPALDKDGNFVIAFEGNQARWEVPYPGWAIKISRDGKKLDGLCYGLRAPNGIAAFGPNRDVFVSDNQGNWIGTCKLNHLQAGKFYGFPSSFPAPNDPSPKEFSPPAIWFPRKLSPSTTDMVEIQNARFGPFVGQMFVGDFQNAVVMRVVLERVNGEWQGAVWPFAKGFLSGVNRLSFGPDAKLYVGGCNRAWAATAPQPYSLDRVTFTGKIPFEIKEVRAKPDGFELIFTHPLDIISAGNPANYDVAQFTYQYHSKYGSAEIDYDGNENSSSEVQVKKVVIGNDGKSVKLVLDGWRAGYVTMVRCLDLQNASGEPLRHDTFYYTLNQIPK